MVTEHHASISIGCFIAYLRIIGLWEADQNVLPKLALTVLCSSIAMVFCYQNLAISKFHQLQRRHEIQPTSSHGKKGSIDGKKPAVDVEFLEKMAIWYAIGMANFLFMVIFLALSRAVLEPLVLSKNIVISTLTPAFILAFFTRL